MRFAVKDHLGESHPLVEALLSAGHQMSPDGPTDLFLIDLDVDLFGYREMVDFYRDCGAVVIQYPHGAPVSTLQYDCLYEPYDRVDGELTNGRGEIDFLRSIGVERPARVMGWQLCTQFEFRPSTEPRRVVFAPTHVNADGTLNRERMETNRDVFKQLLEGGFDLVVRFIGSLDACGLFEDPRARYVQGDVDMTTVEIDSADCVVAGAGTYPCLAIARGVPTIMYGQFAAAMYGLPNEKPKPLRNLERYREIVRYPYDVDDVKYYGYPGLRSMIEEACAPTGEDMIRLWRARWIGEPFDRIAFATMVEEWIPELRARRETSGALVP